MLFIDCLFDVREAHVSHFVWKDTISLLQKVKPKQTYFVGMNHSVDHEAWNQKLKKDLPDLQVECAYDGQCIDFSITQQTKL